MHKDLISDTVLPNTPIMLQYKIHADKKSLYNTPPAYNIYMVGKVLKWIQSLGGLEKMKEINKRKASILYDYLDSSSLFYGLANAGSRSLMNVTFRTKPDGAFYLLWMRFRQEWEEPERFYVVNIMKYVPM